MIDAFKTDAHDASPSTLRRETGVDLVALAPGDDADLAGGVNLDARDIEPCGLGGGQGALQIALPESSFAALFVSHLSSP